MKLTTNRNFTFGYINALFDATGYPIATSQGRVEYDIPADGGHGDGGLTTTNDCLAAETQDTVISLGTTFGLYGSAAADTLFSEYRTYSARASGLVSAE